MPRALKATGKTRHDPLLVQLREDEVHAKYGKVSQPGRRQKQRTDDEDHEEAVLDPKTSRRILELAKDQQDELEEAEDNQEGDGSREPRMQDGLEEEEEEEIEEYVYEPEEEFQIDAGDLKTLDSLLPPDTGERRTLADIIFAKLESGEIGHVTTAPKPEYDPTRPPDPAEGLDPKVVDAYTKVGLILRRHTSPTAPLPKLFKVIPSLPGWARILALTRPEEWSPQATYAATRLFISQMKPAQARVFLEGVLLNAIREDIQDRTSSGKKNNKPLNVHYYEALKKAVYKPSAFYKGIVFPLLEGGCTLKEAAIVASVLAKKKIPVLHSSAALIRIAEMDYTGPNSLFIRVLLDKKYTFPYKVIDALVFHFIRLSNSYKARKLGDAEKLPVLWHQSLLVFCQRYASELTADQKDALLDVVRVNPHPQISPEVRRELVSSVMRGEPRPDADGDVAMS
ncbi:cell adhesion protein byn-1 [Punctularia strigosozonata HHB-11173 SS5]|uniref:cell adhesion protein byn-1 n=1 Tax=Punctularia strigosozonata (strain HHB-11173) TaxID=741275 RepID=UPI0004416D15|nr:cell adhesion protein byn-1 [Punctularia strigosozonata HHB-11173 SS5]EIN10812.1 cell adhesion protein byn-1 [Punctularia strigosozonata HHB-11173 SS5]